MLGIGTWHVQASLLSNSWRSSTCAMMTFMILATIQWKTTYSLFLEHINFSEFCRRRWEHCRSVASSSRFKWRMRATMKTESFGMTPVKMKRPPNSKSRWQPSPQKINWVQPKIQLKLKYDNRFKFTLIASASLRLTNFYLWAFSACFSSVEELITWRRVVPQAKLLLPPIY